MNGHGCGPLKQVPQEGEIGFDTSALPTRTEPGYATAPEDLEITAVTGRTPLRL